MWGFEVGGFFVRAVVLETGVRFSLGYTKLPESVSV